MLKKTYLIKVSLLFFSVVLSACSHSPLNNSTSNETSSRYSMVNDSSVLEDINLSAIAAVIPVVENRTLAGNKNPYTINGETYYLMESERGYVETGTASWYGRKFHGHLTSNGEIYDMFQLSAAHKTMPIPGYLQVTNLDNNRTIVVRVNDRGPFYNGRIVDLSYAAAVMLDYADKGTARVRIEALMPGQPLRTVGTSAVSSPAVIESTQRQTVNTLVTNGLANEVNAERLLIEQNLGQEYLQVGAFSNLNSAQNVRNELSQISPVPVFISSNAEQGSLSPLHKVRLGPVDEIIELPVLIQLIINAGFGQPFRVRQFE